MSYDASVISLLRFTLNDCFHWIDDIYLCNCIKVKERRRKIKARHEKNILLSVELGNRELMRWRIIRKTISDNRSYRGDISFTNIRVISGGLRLNERQL